MEATLLGIQSYMSLEFKSRKRHCRVRLTFVLRSTHSTHDKVGLLRFCLFLGGSAVRPSSLCIGLVTGDALKVVSVTVGEVVEAYVIVPLYTNAGETGPIGPIGPLGPREPIEPIEPTGPIGPIGTLL